MLKSELIAPMIHDFGRTPTPSNSTNEYNGHYGTEIRKRQMTHTETGENDTQQQPRTYGEYKRQKLVGSHQQEEYNNNTSHNETTLDALPDNTQANIASYLTFQDICKLSGTSRRTRKKMEVPELLKSVRIRGKELSCGILKRIVEQNAESLDIPYCTVMNNWTDQSELDYLKKSQANFFSKLHQIKAFIMTNKMT